LRAKRREEKKNNDEHFEKNEPHSIKIMKKTAIALAATLVLSNAVFAAQDASQSGADAWGAAGASAAPRFAVADEKVSARDAQEQKDAARALAEKTKKGADGIALGGRSAIGGVNAARGAHAAPLPGPCENMPVKWAAAEKMARGGEADAALAVYVHLLAACPAPKVAEGTAWKAVGALPKTQRDRLIDGPALKIQDLSAIRSELLLARMTEENKAGQFKAALADSREIRAQIIEARDAGALESSAWLEEQAQNAAEAQNLFRLAAGAAKTPESVHRAQMGLALSFMKEGKLDEALEAAALAPTPDALRLAGSIWLIQAQAASKAGNGEEALRLLDQAALAGVPVGDTEQATRGWALLKMGRAKEAQGTFAALRVDGQNQKSSETQIEARDGFIYAALETRDYGALKDVISEPASVFSAPETAGNAASADAESQRATKMAQEAVAGHYDRMGYFGAAQAARGVPAEGLGASAQAMASYESKSGTQGQDKLRIATVPQLSVVLPPSSFLQARVDAYGLRLDNGARHAWGEGATVSAARQLDLGVVGGSLGVENPGQGTTQILGSARYQWASGSEQEFVHATGSREAVLDSLRSFEGDAAAGIGPATSNKGEIEGRARVFADDVFVQGSFTGGAVTARGTPFNPFYAVGVSLTRDFTVSGWSWLNGGVDLRGGSSRYDANRFDEKVGGYWSPKSNREAGVVFNAQSAEDKQWLFKASARTGYASRELYTGHASGAFSEGTAQVAALASRQVILGAGIGGRTSPGYHDTNVFAWVKIPFGARAHLTAADLAAPRGF